MVKKSRETSMKSNTMGGDGLVELRAVAERLIAHANLDFTEGDDEIDAWSDADDAFTDAWTPEVAVSVLDRLTTSEALVTSLRNQLDSLSQSQPCADAGTHIPRSPREERLLALAEAYEPGNYALCDGVDHVYRDVSNCCQTLRDDIRWALGSDVPFDGGYTPEERRVSDYLLSITEGQIGSGLDPIGFLIASHAAINELRKEAEAALRAAPARSTGGQLGPGTTHETAEIASLRNQLEGAKEALRPFAESTYANHRDMMPWAWFKRARASLAASTLYELEGDQEIGSENTSLRTTLHGADTEAEPAAASDPSSGGGA